MNLVSHFSPAAVVVMMTGCGASSTAQETSTDRLSEAPAKVHLGWISTSETQSLDALNAPRAVAGVEVPNIWTCALRFDLGPTLTAPVAERLLSQIEIGLSPLEAHPSFDESTRSIVVTFPGPGFYSLNLDLVSRDRSITLDEIFRDTLGLGPADAVGSIKGLPCK